VASPTLVSVEEYLKGGYKPACEYLDGVLRQKPMPAWDHGFTQSRVGQLLNENSPDFAAASEITVGLSETRFLVPDVIAQRKTDLQRPYPTQPVHLVVEILSPEDRMSDVIAKCEQYHAWGCATAGSSTRKNRLPGTTLAAAVLHRSTAAGGFRQNRLRSH